MKVNKTKKVKEKKQKMAKTRLLRCKKKRMTTILRSRREYATSP
jgi:hypothetical protein